MELPLLSWAEVLSLIVAFVVAVMGGDWLGRKYLERKAAMQRIPDDSVMVNVEDFINAKHAADSSQPCEWCGQAWVDLRPEGRGEQLIHLDDCAYLAWLHEKYFIVLPRSTSIVGEHLEG